MTFSTKIGDEFDSRADGEFAIAVHRLNAYDGKFLQDNYWIPIFKRFDSYDERQNFLRELYVFIEKYNRKENNV